MEPLQWEECPRQRVVVTHALYDRWLVHNWSGNLSHYCITPIEFTEGINSVFVRRLRLSSDGHDCYTYGNISPSKRCVTFRDIKKLATMINKMEAAWWQDYLDSQR